MTMYDGVQRRKDTLRICKGFRFSTRDRHLLRPCFANLNLSSLTPLSLGCRGQRLWDCEASRLIAP